MHLTLAASYSTYMCVSYFHYWMISFFGSETLLCTPLFLTLHLPLKREVTAWPKVGSLNCGRSKLKCADKILEVAPAPDVTGKARTVKYDKKENRKKNTAL